MHHNWRIGLLVEHRDWGWVGRVTGVTRFPGETLVTVRMNHDGRERHFYADFLRPIVLTDAVNPNERGLT